MEEEGYLSWFLKKVKIIKNKEIFVCVDGGGHPSNCSNNLKSYPLYHKWLIYRGEEEVLRKNI